MWARLLRERFGAKDPNSWKLRTHIQTGGATLTAQQPENNVVRASIQAMASVLGGVQSMALSCYDEALAIPTTEAQRIALRTQQIIAHETGVTDTVDPFGGSYYVESLTDEIERKAQEYIDRIEDMGGAVAAIESGYVQTEIQEAAVRQQQGDRVRRAGRRGREQVPQRRGARADHLRMNTELARGQIERLRRVRETRDGAQAAAALRTLGETARGDEHLMPGILDAVRAYATLGEICGELRKAWGEYRAPTVV